MRNLFFHLRQFTLLLCIGLSIFSTHLAFAETDEATSVGIYAGAGKDDSAIRNGDFTLDDIPKIITGIIEILLGLAGTISIVALIYHALQMQLASGITGDSAGVDKAKSGMKGALLGFALSLSAWFLITKFVELLTSVT